MRTDALQDAGVHSDPYRTGAFRTSIGRARRAEFTLATPRPNNMEVEIATIGGYEEVGRQMTAVRAGSDIVVFDMGLNLSQVLIHDNVETEKMHSLDLIDMGAIPDDRVMSDMEGDVQAIVPDRKSVV